jgi:[ribosomal protein S5]-alanine N-acetyltransferase
MPRLSTPRLDLVPITLDVLEAVISNQRAKAEQLVGAVFPDDWPNEDLIARAFPVAMHAVRADPTTRLWGDTLLLLRGQQRIVGSVIFHGRPSNGIAEVGYGIDERSRGEGLAIEGTTACVSWALTQPGIDAVQATTFPWHAASLGVIRRLGMTEIGSREHDTLGQLMVFELRTTK